MWEVTGEYLCNFPTSYYIHENLRLISFTNYNKIFIHKFNTYCFPIWAYAYASLDLGQESIIHFTSHVNLLRVMVFERTFLLFHVFPRIHWWDKKRDGVRKGFVTLMSDWCHDLFMTFFVIGLSTSPLHLYPSFFFLLLLLILLFFAVVGPHQFQTFRKLSHEPVHTHMPSSGTPVQLTLLSCPDNTPRKCALKTNKQKKWVEHAFFTHTFPHHSDCTTYTCLHHSPIFSPFSVSQMLQLKLSYPANKRRADIDRASEVTALFIWISW